MADGGGAGEGWAQGHRWVVRVEGRSWRERERETREGAKHAAIKK